MGLSRVRPASYRLTLGKPDLLGIEQNSLQKHEG